MAHQYTLVFDLDDSNNDHDVLIEKLGAAGFTECLLGIAVPGRLGITFSQNYPVEEHIVRAKIDALLTLLTNSRLSEFNADPPIKTFK